jgi:hypothetical protein
VKVLIFHCSTCDPSLVDRAILCLLDGDVSGDATTMAIATGCALDLIGLGIARTL